MMDGTAKSKGQFLNAVDGDVFLAPFDGADVCAMDPGQMGQLILGQPLCVPQAAQVARENLACFQGWSGSHHVGRMKD
jgi:hypothetical protein